MRIKITGSIIILLGLLCISCHKIDNQIKRTADEIITILENKKYNELADYIDKESGLYIAQKITAPLNYFNHISYNDIINATENDKKFEFYVDDDPSELWNTTLYNFIDTTFSINIRRNRRISYNAYISLINWELGAQTIQDLFPNSFFIEYFYEPSGLYGDIDWESIYLIFREDNKGIVLIGMACNYGGI